MATWHAIWSKRRAVGFAMILATPIFSILPLYEPTWIAYNAVYVALILLVIGWGLIISTFRRAPKPRTSPRPSERPEAVMPASYSPATVWRITYRYCVWQNAILLLLIHLEGLAVFCFPAPFPAGAEIPWGDVFNIIIGFALLAAYLVILIDWVGGGMRAFYKWAFHG